MTRVAQVLAPIFARGTIRKLRKQQGRQRSAALLSCQRGVPIRPRIRQDLPHVPCLRVPQRQFLLRRHKRFPVSQKSKRRTKGSKSPHLSIFYDTDTASCRPFERLGKEANITVFLQIISRFGPPPPYFFSWEKTSFGQVIGLVCLLDLE
jgi:hypothetical protein